MRPAGGRFEGKVAVVVGAARPPFMGRNTALALAEEGADVVCIDDTGGDPRDDNRCSPTELTDVVAQIAALRRRAVAVTARFTELRSVEAAVEAAIAQWGRIDLVACLIIMTGNGFGDRPFVELRIDGWLDTITANLGATWVVNRTVARQLAVQGGGGAIVNLSSEATRAVPAGFGAYAVAKSGVETMTRVLARELGPLGIRVNAVAPLSVFEALPSEGVASLAHQRFGSVEAWINETIPLQRHQSPDEFARLVCHLLSDDSSFVSGETIFATGGAI